AGLIDGVERPEPHGDRGELPEVRHQSGVRIRRQALAADLQPEVVEMLLIDASLEERPGVDARRGVALEEDLVAGLPVVLAAEEVVEADLVEAGARRIGGQMA